VAGGRATKQFGKQGRAVDPRSAHPHQPSRWRNQGHHATVREHGVFFNRHSIGTGQPGLAGTGDLSKPTGHFSRIGDAIPGSRLAVPHLDRHIRAVHP